MALVLIFIIFPHVLRVLGLNVTKIIDQRYRFQYMRRHVHQVIDLLKDRRMFWRPKTQVRNNPKQGHFSASISHHSSNLSRTCDPNEKTRKHQAKNTNDQWNRICPGYVT